MTYAVEVSSIYKNYSGEHALDGVGFCVAPGSLFGIIGADGAGKSTLMRILTTLINADKGAASVLGRDVGRDFQYLRTHIGYMPQKFSLYQDLSVAENLQFFADIFGLSRSERISHTDRLLKFSRLTAFKDRRAGNLSGGMKQKLALSCTLIHTPEVLFLDEPTTGVDPVSRKEFWNILFELKRQGIAVVLSTPYMEEAELCDDLLLLDKGKAVLQGTPAQIISRYPYRLYKVEPVEGQTLTWPRARPLPEGIAEIFPAGGALQVAAGAADLSPETVLARIRALEPRAAAVVETKPRIEDVFVHMLTGDRAFSAKK